MSDLLVYSAIFAGRDLVEVPKLDGADFRLITDDVRYAKTGGISVIPMPIEADPRRSARLLKIMPQLFFPDYRRWIWMDGNVRLREWTNGKRLKEIPGPLTTFKHRDRNCPYEEAEICSTFSLDKPSVIQSQMEGYRNEGFPPDGGLAETMVVVRDNTPEIQSFNRRWWAEVCEKSVRDQLSFNYCVWKEGIPVHYMGRCSGTPWFRIGPHAND